MADGEYPDRRTHTSVIRMEMLDLPYVQGVCFAAVELMREVEDGDEALLPDAVVEAAARLRAALARERLPG